MAQPSARSQLASFIARYHPAVARVARDALAKLRRRLPGAVQLVYDNYNALVIGFSPSERASDAVFSIALYPRWVNLFFLHGAKLPDPNKRLRGSGKQVRSLVLTDANVLDDPQVQTLISKAIEQTAPAFASGRRGRLIIKSISPRQRPRRPA